MQRNKRTPLRAFFACILSALLILGFADANLIGAARAADPTPTPSASTAPSAAPTATQTASVAPRADPSSGEMAITISQITDPKQPASSLTYGTNRTFSYLVSYNCSSLTANECGTKPVITIPLGPAREYNPTIAKSPSIASTEYTADNKLVIHLVPVQAGQSVTGQIGLSLSPPYLKTPNGTKWSVGATLSFDDSAATATTPTPVASTATADFDPRIYMSTPSQASSPGANVRFNLYYYCQGSVDNGTEAVKSLTIVDTLPAGLEYVADAGLPVAGVVTGDPATGQTVTWTLKGDQIGAWGCVSVNNSASSWTLDTRVATTVPSGTNLLNSVTLNGMSISDAGPKTSTARQNVYISTGAYRPATSSKTGFGSITQPVGDDAATNNQGGYYSATFPGRWRTATGTIPMNWDATYAATEGQVEGTFAIDVEVPTQGEYVGVKDPMPCLVGSGPRYESQSDALCQKPAFHPLYVQIEARNGQAVIPADLVPTATLTDGSIVSLVRLASNDNPLYGTWSVPKSAVGKIAEINFPANPKFTEQRPSFRISGYADAGVKPGSTLLNTSATTTFGPDGSNAGTVSDSGRLFVLTQPQIGTPIFNAWDVPSVDSSYAMLYSTISSVVPIKADWVITMQAPAGLDITSMSADLACNGDPCVAPDGNPAAIGSPNMTTSTDPATGNRIIRMTYPADRVNALLATGATRIRASMFINMNHPAAGTYNLTASTFLNDAAIDKQNCISSTAQKTDPQDLDANDSTADFHCDRSASFTAYVDPFSTSVQISKAVRGSTDTGFRTYPAIGTIPPSGGTASYNLTWKSYSGTPMKNVVLYDMLPMPGDHGTLSKTAKVPRGSTFRPELQPITNLPTGVSVQYSTAANPCRPEVLPTNDGCTNSWLSTAPADLSTVTALRFASSQTYQSLEGFTVPLSFAMPAAQVTTSDVAWNTFAASQQTTSGQKTDPVESAKAGIALAAFAHVSIGKDWVSNDNVMYSDSQYQYRLHATNDGNTAIPDGTITDVIPAGMTVVNAAGGTVSNGTITWQTGALRPGDSTYRTVTLGLPQGAAPGDYTNRMRFASTVSPSIASDENPCTDNAAESCVTGTLPPYPLVTLDKTVAEKSPGPGDLVHYTLTLKNSGTADDTEGFVEDDLGGNLEYVSSSPTADDVEVQDDDSHRTTISFNELTIPKGETRTLSVVARVKAGAYDQPLINVASGSGIFRSYDATATSACTQEQLNAVWASTPDASAPGAYRYYACAEAKSPAYAPAITLTKTASEQVAKVGALVTYSFEVTNSGAQTLHNVKVNEGDFVNGKGEPVSLDAAPAAPAEFDGTLAAGAHVVFTATHTMTQADVDAGGSLRNTASAVGTTALAPDGVTHDVTSTSEATLPVQTAGPSLAVVKTAAKAPNGTTYRAGETVPFTIEVRNNGNVTMSAVSLSDAFFANAAGTQLSLAHGPTAPAGFTGTLAPGATAVFTADYVVTTEDVAAGPNLTNLAVASGQSPTGDAVTATSRVFVPVDYRAPVPPTKPTEPTDPGPTQPSPTQPTNPGAPGALPYTGASVLLPAGIALLLLAAGVTLVIRRRRRA